MESDRRTSTGSAPAIPRRLQACERCWKRKQKVLADDVCDRQLPACTTCVEADAQCAPRRVPIGPTTEEGSGLSHAAVPNYVETLKRKRDELDAQFRQQRARRERDESVPGPQLSPNMETTSAVSPGESNQTPSTAPTSFSERSVQAAMGEIGFLSRNAMAEPRDETRGFPQELAMGNMVRAALVISGEDPSQSRDLCNHRRTFVTMMGPATGITKEFATPYVNRFLDHVGVMFLHIDRRKLQGEFDSYFDAHRGQPSHTKAPNSDTAFLEFKVYMAVAIGMLLSPEPGSELLATGLHAAATERLTIILEQGNCVKTLHCLWSLALYSMFSSLGGSTWHLVGLAMKKCISFRLHREPYPDSDISQEELNSRRSIFWALYVLDRTISCVMDRPFSIEDEDILVQLPVYNSTSKTVTEFDFGYHIIMHARLLSSVRSSSSRGRLYHYRNLRHWRDLPKSVKDFVPGDGALSVSIKQLTCRALTQIALLTRGTQPNGGIVRDARAVEHDVVDSCQAYINAAYSYSEQGKLAASFIDGFDLFAAGVLVTCLPSLSSIAGPPRETAIISKCTALLTTIGERFPSLKVLRKLLLALSSVAAQGAYHDPALDELPEIISDPMQDLIQDFLRKYSVIEYIENMAPGITEPSSSAGPSTAESKPTVYVLDTFPPKAIEYAKTLFNIIQPQDEEFKNWRQNARALLVRSSYVTADDIASCPNLIAISKHGVGIDKINQDACAQRGIKILNTPGANARDVAELVVALALSVARGIRSITTRQMLKPVPKETCNGLTLYQKTIGIIGMGNIGRTVAEIFRGGFDANIVAYDAYMPEDVWSHIPHTRAKTVDEVLAQADVLSVHVPLTGETRDMISYEQIRAMKPDAILINAARGGIINEADLTKALSEGYLWGAGLDCHEQEPPSHEKYEALWKNLNVVSTPHIGAATSRAQLACATAAVDNLYQHLSRL
ncbi:D-isomer specific 2-hydroxyacid dehydrogenase [Aspergillus parasiticus]|uniref:D-isomer specific 2-hydroxyacid dehydrogenase n=1 Tax=Aspergillus parasiticus TaxID=5067 RepID=A0A5N6DG06_ASPPA|nr:D-isomer specific 2-hydroxyacid dehydrogenase [Aspergillus parasiticus]